MQGINKGVTQLKLEPANTNSLKAFVGELNGNIKLLEKAVSYTHLTLPTTPYL